MANTQDIRRRIKSIRNTAQITKAMQMVAASKMRKAQQHALAGRPYAESDEPRAGFAAAADRSEAASAPAGARSEEGTGCRHQHRQGTGGRAEYEFDARSREFRYGQTVYVTSGRKARQFVARTNRELLADFELKDAPAIIETKAISKFCVEKFLSGEVDKVSVALHSFHQHDQPAAGRANAPADQPVSIFRRRAAAETGRRAPVRSDARIYSSSRRRRAVLDFMLPYYLQYQVFQMILDARASEHSARMVAMKNATDNAKQFIKDLTLEYNKMRQASITTELLEIATAQMAVGG